MAILVCGGAGYIGSHINKQLNAAGANQEGEIGESHNPETHLKAWHYLENGNEGDFFNLGNAIGTSVLEVIELVRRVKGRDFKVTLAECRAGDPAKLVGSSEKARQILGCQPKYGQIDTIVSHAWRWHENAEY